jgi:hypothetical protein
LCLRKTYGKIPNMENETRFEFRLSADRRRALSELARESGLSASDLARLAVRRLIENPGALVRGRPAKELRANADEF